MSIFGHDYKGRKNIPIFHLITRYFPKALVEVTRVCVAGNAQHNPELSLFDINWSRDKSKDQLNTALRHMMDHATSGPLDEEPPEVLAALGLEDGDSTYHLAKAAWRVLAALELEIEARQAEKGEEAAKKARLRLGRGHTWAGKNGDILCPKCGRAVHNLAISEYDPESFLPAFEGTFVDLRHD